jgi:Holliday junction resolvasome RuvABC endonuclease subunit
MIIPVCGMDPSLNHWGIAETELDLRTGLITTPRLQTIEPNKITAKQVRQNSIDLDVAQQLARTVLHVAKRNKVVFVECPVGSQSARAMASYGICVGILGSLLGSDIQLIEVTASEVKQALTGKQIATKGEMIAEAIRLYPKANFPIYRGKVTLAAEHAADAIGAIHAGVNTPLFRNLIKLYA